MRVRSLLFIFFFHDRLAIKHIALPKCSLLDIFLWDSEVNIVFVILKLGNSYGWDLAGSHLLVSYDYMTTRDMEVISVS